MANLVPTGRPFEGGGQWVVKNPLFLVHWAGLEGDSLTMQEQGWEFSVRKDEYGMNMQFAMKHEQMGYVGVSPFFSYMEWAIYQHLDYCGLQRIFDKAVSGRERPMDMPMVQMHIAKTIYFQEARMMDAYAIDARPACVNTMEVRDMFPFIKFNVEARKQILVDPKNVPELMEMVLRAQDPKKAEILARWRQEERTRKYKAMTAHAEIVSVEI